MELLLTVEDHFLIKGRGLVVLPWLDYPENRRFKSFSDEVVIRRPDETEERCLGYFLNMHLNFGSRGSKTVISLQFPEGTKETVPIGSQIFASEGIWQKLQGEVPNKLEEADV